MDYAFGVSPAFYISLVTNRFTVDDVCKAIPVMSGLGFRHYQPEVFYEENLAEWVRGSGRVQAAGDGVGMKASQFVAHFMMHYFAGDGLLSNKGLSEIESVIQIAGQFEGCSQITVPVAPYVGLDNLSSQEKSALKQRAIAKLFDIFQKIERANMKMALEILPGALITIKDDFKFICDQFNSPNIGLNLDTGHAHASGEDVANLPLECAGRIFGTHLCDNFGPVNDSLKPGAGSIRWDKLMRNLINSGYSGSLDIEIHCRPELAETEYGEGKAYLETIIRQFKAS